MTSDDASKNTNDLLAWVFRTDEADAGPQEVTDLTYRAMGMTGLVFALAIPGMLIDEVLGETILVWGFVPIVFYTLAKHAWITRGRNR